MQPSKGRYLCERGYTHSILKSKEFASPKDVLEGKVQVICEDGKRRRRNKSSSLTTEEEEALWISGQLGDQSPLSLINTLWWIFTQHFGMRGRQEHYSMRIEHFQFKKSDQGTEYVTFSVGITKTRQSRLHNKHRLVIPKMLAIDTERCPAHFFKLYLSKRPKCRQNNGPFYLPVVVNPKSDVCYKVTAMGVNKVNEIMKEMVISF